MNKGWNRVTHSRFRSFYLELMVQNILQGISISEDPSGVRYVLDAGRQHINYAIADPPGFDSHVNGLVSLDVPAAVRAFQEAYDLAAQAELWAAAGYGTTALRTWRRLFGDYLPQS
jgi:hypothetical protein